MNEILTNMDALKKLCEQHYVARLSVFGSVLTQNFNESSDIDFLVQFSGVDQNNYFDNFLDFKESLESLLGRNVDLLEEQTLKNPILIRSIERNKKLLYG